MSLRKTSGPRDDGNADVPEILVLVVLLEADAAIFGLADVGDRKARGLDSPNRK